MPEATLHTRETGGFETGRAEESLPDDSSFGPPEFWEGGDYVVVQIPFHTATRGLELSTDVAWVYTIREGLITRLEYFHSTEEALEAAGLSE